MFQLGCKVFHNEIGIIVIILIIISGAAGLFVMLPTSQTR